MSAIHTIAQIMERHFAADQALAGTILKEEQAMAGKTTEFSEQILARVKTAQSLTSQIQSCEITIDWHELPPVTAALKSEPLLTSDAARDRLNAARGAIPRVEERIENDLQAIDGMRKTRAQALRRLQVVVAAAIVLAAVFSGIVLDRLGKAQTAYDAAVAALNRGDLAAFDQGIAVANELVPHYRAAEMIAARSAWQARENLFLAASAALVRAEYEAFDTELAALRALDPEFRIGDVAAMVKAKTLGVSELQYQVAVAALKRNDPVAFDRALAVLTALDPEYRKSETLAYRSWRLSGIDLERAQFDMSRVIFGRNTVSLTAPISLTMVLVPAGSFLMGSDPRIDIHASRTEQPQHTVTLKDFWIGRTEITIGQFSAYAKAKGLAFVGRSHGDDYPVYELSLSDALGFVSWLSDETGLGFRLPTEEEWEKACRGTDGRIFPWGNSFDRTRTKSRESTGGLTAVGAYSPDGDSPFGVADMAGNVWEWTSSYPTSNYGPTAEVDTTKMVLRGADVLSLDINKRCAVRLWSNPNQSHSSGGGGEFGFRVVVSAFYQ